MRCRATWKASPRRAREPQARPRGGGGELRRRGDRRPVRHRSFDQDALNRVWGEYFRDSKPATTTVQVVRLATDPRCLVEINAVAVVD